jgi:hypothetical protein
LLFILHGTFSTAYLLVYVDDIILTASSSTFLERIITAMSAEFAMTDLGVMMALVLSVRLRWQLIAPLPPLRILAGTWTLPRWTISLVILIGST